MDKRLAQISKALILTNAKLEPHKVEEKVALIKKEGASTTVLARAPALEGRYEVYLENSMRS